MLGHYDSWCPAGHGDRDLPGRGRAGRRLGSSRRSRREHLHRTPVKRSAPIPTLTNGQRGAVLPLAMLILVALSGVLLGLSLLTGREPLIASNHVMLVQAQALAEAGLERALWALSTPESSDGIPWSARAAAPYDGTQFIGVATEFGAMLGGFRLTVTGEGDRQRELTAVGLVPGDVAPLGRALQDISATLIRLRFPPPPAR